MTKRAADCMTDADGTAEKAGGAAPELVEVNLGLISGVALLALQVPATTRVGELKEQVHKEKGNLPSQQQLLAPGTFQKLDDDQSVAELRAGGGSVDLILVLNATFWPCSRFEGVKQGYAFKLGPEGLGYYHDEYQEGDGGAKRDPWDGLWLTSTRADASSVVVERGQIYWGGYKSVPKGTSLLQKLDDRGFFAKGSDPQYAELSSVDRLCWKNKQSEAFTVCEWTRASG